MNENNKYYKNAASASIPNQKYFNYEMPVLTKIFVM